MKKYSYQEFVAEINKHFKKDARLSVRTVKFWVEAGLLKEPGGAGRWRHFSEEDLHHVISIRKLQVIFGQTIEAIKEINQLAHSDLYPKSIAFDSYELWKVVKALEGLDRRGLNAVAELEAFKRSERTLVLDNEQLPAYRLININQLAGSYIEENGKVFRIIKSLIGDEGETRYFKPAQLEKYYSQMNARRKKFTPELPRIDVKAKAEELRALLKARVMTEPRYRFKNEDHISDHDIQAAHLWLSISSQYALPTTRLLRLRTRIEEDIQNYFYAPEGDVFAAAPIIYKFRKQVELVNNCINFIISDQIDREEPWSDEPRHDRIEESVRILNDYINGFLYLSPSIDHNIEICFQRTPIDQLTPRQIKIGLAEGRFSSREIEKLVRDRESDLSTLKALLTAGIKQPGRK